MLTSAARVPRIHESETLLRKPTMWKLCTIISYPSACVSPSIIIWAFRSTCNSISAFSFSFSPREIFLQISQIRNIYCGNQMEAMYWRTFSPRNTTWYANCSCLNCLQISSQIYIPRGILKKRGICENGQW